MAIYFITDFGAKNDGKLCTNSIQEAIDTANLNGGGQIIVPEGVFVTGALF